MNRLAGMMFKRIALGALTIVIIFLLISIGIAALYDKDNQRNTERSWFA
jgi:hypothetical protein